VTVALRPEAVSLGPGAPDADRLSGTVSDVTFLGSIVRVRVRLPDGTGPVAFDTFNNPHVPPPGIDAPITISFPSEALLVLDASATEADELAEGLDAA
jgi:putative spermidine/putrescine transport system ATP-binding protein